ncbi:MAG TPA: molybdopterin converting factor subunit 1 [Vicinamibacterales bacterium]|jgi:molybdopterin synthase sulfur carrier subunit|nr:molybdopterin converting factor subunit 1 [Vicinamibacterales bacterium]
MHVTVRLFARLHELAGQAEFARDLPPGSTAEDAWRAIVTDHPEMASYTRAISCAVNASYVKLNRPLADGDEVVFMPPVSGG